MYWVKCMKFDHWSATTGAAEAQADATDAFVGTQAARQRHEPEEAYHVSFEGRSLLLVVVHLVDFAPPRAEVEKRL